MENEIIFYTNAPESYDGFGTKTLEITNYIDQRKNPVRKISVPERAVVWQKNRNSSGMNVTIEADEFDNVKDIYFKRQSEIKEVNPFVKPEDLKSPEAEETETIVKPNPTSLQIANYKNPYEVNRAIERLLNDKGSESENYTPDEVAFISNYSGYGGLEKFGQFSDEELKGLLYEFFTPDEIVKKMWGLAYKYGYGTIGDNSVFEPSVGVGAFLKYAPNDVFVAGNEINRYSAMICHILYPEAQITLMPFEKNFIVRNLSVKNQVDRLPYLENRKFSLVIGNPPYGKLGGKYISMGEDKYTKAQNLVEYFIFRGLDLLVKDGLLIYVVGAEQYNGGTLFLDGGLTPAKKVIFDKADLVDAYRLPARVFERTGVSSEILIFRKR